MSAAAIGRPVEGLGLQDPRRAQRLGEPYYRDEEVSFTRVTNSLVRGGIVRRKAWGTMM